MRINCKNIVLRLLQSLALSTILVNSASGQIGGIGTFDFLNLTQSARSIALGGNPIALSDDDVAQVFNNPALLNHDMGHHVSVNHNFHFADISFGSFGYALPLTRDSSNFFIGVNYINYGSFVRADNIGTINGEFSASESALHLGYSRKIDERLRLGIVLKYADSNLENFGATGIGGDVGIFYSNSGRNSSWAFVLKNIGGQFTSFSAQRESYPTELQIGFQKRLAHIPFRYMITAHNLQRWDLTSPLDTEEQTIFIGSTEGASQGGFSKAIDNLFRHLSFGGEILIGSNEVVRVRFGYNHLLNKELSVSGFRSLSGFSFGFGLRIKKIRFDYGVGRYHLAGGVNHLSLSIDLQSIMRKI